MKTFDTTKLFAAKSSVTRAIKAAGQNPEHYNIVEQDGKFRGEPKSAPKKVKAETKPRNGNCATVWAIADKMVGERRKDVVAACVAAGVPEGTAKTQYQHWFVSKKG
jgi:hypothetical protein